MLIQLVDGKQESALFADGGGWLTLGRILFSVCGNRNLQFRQVT
jgi:hypothetical protein